MIIIKSTNSELGELVASITLANPFLFFLRDCPSGGAVSIFIFKHDNSQYKILTPSYFNSERSKNKYESRKL